MEATSIIEAKDLQFGDLFKLGKLKRNWHRVTGFFILDPENLPQEEREKPYRKNKVLIMEGCKQLTLDKNREVIRLDQTINS